MENQNKIKVLIWRRAFSALIDIVFIFCTGYLVHRLISLVVFIDPFIIYSIIWVLYYVLFYLLLNGRTLAKMITGLKVITHNNAKIGIKNILIRELLCKFFLLFLIPYYLLVHTHIYNHTQLPPVILITAISFTIVVLITLVLLFIYKKAWWELASMTKTVKASLVNRSARHISILAISGIFLLTMFGKIYPFFTNKPEQKPKSAIDGAFTQLYKFYPEYPINAETRKYADFVRSHSQDPVDYVFDLFDKYDLVVLNERLHPEYTQYELYSKIIRDKRFLNKIGNIYTEIGSVSYQDTLNNFIHTVFLSEDSLNKAAALLQRNSNGMWPIWELTNFFIFLKLVNTLNSELADSLKIDWYFTDMPVNWETMTSSAYKKRPHYEHRDSIMAVNIIDIYKDKLAKNERRKKGLVIMNFRHGYGLIRDNNGVKTGHFFNKLNTTPRLMDLLPGKVCNVLINTVRYGPAGFEIIFFPIQHGKWDKAFNLAGNPDAGFDFKNSPFGDDEFDAFLGVPPEGLTYKDLFTGFIFYKPLEKHIKKHGFPYMLYNFEDSLIRREGCIGSDPEATKNWMKQYRNDQIFTMRFPYALFYNFIFNIGSSIIILFTLIIGLIFYTTPVKV